MNLTELGVRCKVRCQQIRVVRVRVNEHTDTHTYTIMAAKNIEL